ARPRTRAGAGLRPAGRDGGRRARVARGARRPRARRGRYDPPRAHRRLRESEGARHDRPHDRSRGGARDRPRQPGGAAGRARRRGYRNVVVGAVERVDEFLARVHEALDADPLLPTALAKVVPIEATVRIEAPTAVETLAAVAEPFIDRLAGGSFFVRLERRGLKGRLHTPTIERALGDHVWRALEARGHTPRVDFKDPDAVLVVE